MRTISTADIHNAVYNMILDANRNLSPDVYAALTRAKAEETSATGVEILRQLLENADLAAKTGLPLCQDTGAAIFFIEIGEDCRVVPSEAGNAPASGSGSSASAPAHSLLQTTVENAMIAAYKDGFLRKSLCNPLTRANTGTNAPAIIHTNLVAGDALRIRYMAKGGGSENMSRCTMLTPAQGWAGIKEFVVQRMAEAGPNPCPPTIVGVGIGGTFDLAPTLAKEALFRPLNDVHPDPAIAAMEKELFDAINALGIGAMGLGGNTTCLGVKIAMHPCHIASLPLAINVQCHSSRHTEVIL